MPRFDVIIIEIYPVKIFCYLVKIIYKNLILLQPRFLLWENKNCIYLLTSNNNENLKK